MNMERRHRQGASHIPPQRISGMPCPKCHGFIPISMYQILTCGSIYCPCCGLRLNINGAASARAIEALRKVEEAQRRVEKASHFDGTRR